MQREMGLKTRTYLLALAVIGLGLNAGLALLNLY